MMLAYQCSAGETVIPPSEIRYSRGTTFIFARFLAVLLTVDCASIKGVHVPEL